MIKGRKKSLKPHSALTVGKLNGKLREKKRPTTPIFGRDCRWVGEKKSEKKTPTITEIVGEMAKKKEFATTHKRRSEQIVDLEANFQHIAVRNCSSGYDTSIFN